MGGGGKDVNVRYRADTSDVQRAQQEMGRGAKELGAGIQGVGRGLTRTLTPAALAVGAVLRKAGTEWKESVNAIRTGTGETGKALDDLVGSAKNVSKGVTQPFSEVGQVIADLHTRTGQTGEGLENLSTQVLNLSRVTGTDATQNVAAATRVFGDWSIATEDQSEALDSLFRASQATGIEVTKLMELTVQFGAPMRELGFSFAETTALLGSFEKSGVNTELVMGGLKQGLGRLAKAGKDPRAEIDNLSKSIDEAGLTAENKQRIFEMFGARAGIDMAKAIEEGRFKLGDLIETVESGSETIKKAADDTLTLTDRMGMLGKRALTAMGPFGEVGSVVAGGLAAIGPALMGVGLALPMLAKVGRGMGLMGAAVGRTAVAATRAAATTVAAVARQVAAWVMLGVKSLIAAAKVALAWLIALGPIALVVAAVIAAVALIVLNWEKIKNAITTAVSFVINFVKSNWPLLIGIILGPIGIIVALIIKNWDTVKGFLLAVWNTIKSVASAVWNGITGAISTAVETVRDVITSVWNAITSTLSGIWNGIRSTASSVWNGITSIISGVASTIGGIIDRIVGTFQRILDVFGRVKAGAAAVRDAVVGFISNMVDRIIGQIQRAIEWFKKLAFWRKSPSLLEIHAKASAEGVVKSFEGLAKTLPRISVPVDADIIAVNKLAARVAAAGGHSRVGQQTIVINVTASGATRSDADHIAERVRDELLRIDRRTGRVL